jgi:hypothetical protein
MSFIHDSSYFRSQGEAILGKKRYIDKRGSSALFKHGLKPVTVTADSARADPGGRALAREPLRTYDREREINALVEEHGESIQNKRRELP